MVARCRLGLKSRLPVMFLWPRKSLRVWPRDLVLWQMVHIRGMVYEL